MKRPELAELARFRFLLRRLLGLQCGAPEILAELLQRRTAALRMSMAAYLEMLAPGPDAETALLAQELTVTETYFFRNEEHMRAFHSLLPGASRILCAGCASGEEPYSLAMIAQGAGAAPSIQAFDINRAALARAEAGRYSPWSLRQTPAGFRARCFTREGQGFVLADEIRRMVSFSRRNLAAEDAAFWQPASFDMVFCRNVLMYFTPQAARRAIARIAASLVPGGTLFLGHAETLRGLSGDFRLVHAHGTFYYQRKGAARPPAYSPAPRPERRLVPPQETPMTGDISWYGDILRASARIRALTSTQTGTQAGGCGEG